jgi:hypothetical protein
VDSLLPLPRYYKQLVRKQHRNKQTSNDIIMSYQHLRNPDPPTASATYYTFNHGDVSFSSFGTPCCLSPSSDSDGEMKMMLGRQQRRAFESGITHLPGWKVIVTGVFFTRNFRSAINQ